jgi:hypothetical protein
LEHSGVARQPAKTSTTRHQYSNTTLWIPYERVYRNVVTHCDPPETLRVGRPEFCTASLTDEKISNRSVTR